MWPVSARFRAEVARPLTAAAVSTASIERPGHPSSRIDLEVTGGTVTIDRTRVNRRTVTIGLLDRDRKITPTAPSRPLHPIAGWLLSVSRGLQWPDGTRELVPLIVARIHRPRVTETPEGLAIEATGTELSRAVSRGIWTSTVRLAGSIRTIIEQEIARTVPYATVNLPPDFEASTLPIARDSDDDPWQVLYELAESAGWDLVWSPRAAEVTASRFASADVVSLSGIVVEAAHDLDDEQTTNGVIVIGEHPDLEEPIHVTVWDEDENSPTWIHGPYGMVPRRYSSPTISTEQQALDAGRQILARNQGLISQASLAAIPDPSIDVSDRTVLDRPDIGLTGDAVLDRIDMPLDVEAPMICSVRRRL